MNELNKLLLLEELRFHQNPVLQDKSAETSRQLIIARIGSLKVTGTLFFMLNVFRIGTVTYGLHPLKSWVNSRNFDAPCTYFSVPVDVDVTWFFEIKYRIRQINRKCCKIGALQNFRVWHLSHKIALFMYMEDFNLQCSCFNTGLRVEFLSADILFLVC